MKFVTPLISSAILLCLATISAMAAPPDAPQQNLVKNSDFKEQAAFYEITGNAKYRYLGDPVREVAGWGVALQSGAPLSGVSNPAGSVTQRVTGIDSKAGRWFRFSFRGLPQENFAVTNDDLRMKVAFFGNGGRTSYDAKAKEIYDLVQQARRDLSVNGVRKTGGAAVWRNYVLEFRLPFPQVDEVRLSVEFGHGVQGAAADSAFFVTDFSLVQIPSPPENGNTPSAGPHNSLPQGTPLALGGHWYYDAKPGETSAPKVFDQSNADRLLYRDSIWSAPFSGNMSAWLRKGEKDLGGNVVQEDRLIPDNVTVRFDATTMIIHTHGVPNHPTGKFPEQGYGCNPSFIQEQNSTYCIPLEPKMDVSHIVTTDNNSNHALPMGPIGVAVNGVVFFNPFDMGNRDATDLMDYCCGHPNQMNLYHYHKYPICVNSPWSDEGRAHSPLLGWAFDGYPIYGPYESNGLMAKDVGGASALNTFNMHFDKERGWHYHVTPGRFPYLIGGFWGTEDQRDAHHGPPGGGGRMFGGGQRPPPPPWGGGGYPPGPPPQ